MFTHIQYMTNTALEYCAWRYQCGPEKIVSFLILTYTRKKIRVLNKMPKQYILQSL